MKRGSSLRELAAEERNAARAAETAAKTETAALAKAREAQTAGFAEWEAGKSKAQGATQAVEGLDNGLLRLFGVSRETRLAIKEFSGGLDAAKLAEAGAVAGALALAAGIAAVSVAAVSGAVSLAKWTFATAEAGRNLEISRQAIAGSREDTARMGDQIDLLRRKVPLATEALSELYRQVRTTFDNSAVSGKGILNTVQLLGSATAAAGKEASSKVEALITRGKDFGRFGIAPGSGVQGARGFGAGELAGTGIKFDQVASALAAQENISIAKARQMLIAHTVEINTGIKALTTAAGEAYGDTLSRKLLSTDAIMQKFRDDGLAIAKGVNLEPLLRGLSKIEEVFSTTTTSGYALKQVVTALSTVLFGQAAGGAPLIVTALRIAVLELVKMATAAIVFATWIKRGVAELEAKTGSLRVAFQVLGDTIAIAFAPITLALKGAEGIKSILSGIHGSPGAALAAAGGTRQPQSFPRDVASPGAFTRPALTAPAHAEGGLVMRPAPGELFASVAPGERIVPSGGGGRAGGGAGGGRGGGIVVHVALNFQGGGTPQQNAAAITGSSFISDLTKAIEDALDSAGVPKQAIPG